MSYDSIEKSNHGSSPVLFFQFQRKTIFWRYTNADRDAVMNGVEWSATPIIVGGHDQSGSSDSDSLPLTVLNTLEAMQSFRGQTPSDAVSLTIFQAHATGTIPAVAFDTDLAAVFVGTISDVKQGTSNTLTVTCKTISSAFDREGLGPAWGRNCFHIIYDHECRVDRNAFKVNANLEALTGATVTSSQFALHGDGWYDGGYLEFVVGDTVYQRIAIERQIGPTCKLFGTTEALSIGALVSVYPGCAQTVDHCVNKFNNIANYGGCDIMSGTSPFDGNPVF